MGKGDKRSKKGKIRAGSWGVYRPRKKAGAYVVTEEDLNKKAAKLEASPKKTAKRREVAKVQEEEVKVAETAVAEKVEEKVEETKAAEESNTKTTNDAPKGDLKKIEGIGPATEKLFNKAGILSFADLASTEVDKLKEILAEAGSRYKLLVPDTWPEQAALAAADKWDELKQLQDKLDGGKRVD